MPNTKRKTRPTEAEIQAQIAADPDDFEPTGEELAAAKPFAEVFPNFPSKKSRGRPKLEAPQEPITLRLDPEVIAKFRQTGKGWRQRMQERVNTALKKTRV
jgi:uncharacterized protein (DUF4415 family)